MNYLTWANIIMIISYIIMLTQGKSDFYWEIYFVCEGISHVLLLSQGFVGIDKSKKGKVFFGAAVQFYTTNAIAHALDLAQSTYAFVVVYGLSLLLFFLSMIAYNVNKFKLRADRMG